MSVKQTLPLVAAFLAFAAAAGAQTPPPAPPAHKGLFGNMFHKKPGMTPGMHPGMMGSHPGMMGSHMGMHPGMAPGMGMGMHPGMGGSAMMGGGSAMMGGIIGNKNSHVYHLPGDKGSMPSAANRVYFRTEQQAMAAGYHAAGSRGMSHGMSHGNMHKMHS